MSLYKPPINVTTAIFPFLGLVTRVDPAWARDKFWEVEYEFSGMIFEGNPYVRGLYNRLSNTYPVGTQYGGPDPLIAAALAPTVGVAVPGLFSGVPDGNGWA